MSMTLCTLNKCSLPISQLSSVEQLSASDLFILERVEATGYERYPILQEQHQQYTDEELAAGDVVDAILLELGTAPGQVDSFLYNEMLGDVLGYIHSNGKITYSELSTRLLYDLSAMFNFNTMSTRDTWEYARAGHSHKAQYSDTRVFPMFPEKNYDSQLWLGNFTVWQQKSGSYTSSEISVYSPRIEFPAYTLPDIGEVRFMGWPSLPTSTSESSPVHISVYQQDEHSASEKVPKIVTWNIQHCLNHGIDGIGSVLKSLDADVYCLQEVDKNTDRSGSKDQLEELRLQLGSGWKKYFTKAFDYQNGEYGIGMLCKQEPVQSNSYPITPVVETDEQRVMQILEFEKFVVANVHLASKGIDSQRLQQAEFVLLKLEELGTSKPIWLCGDLNNAESSSILTKLKSKFTIVSKTNGTTVINSTSTVIDYILVSPAYASKRTIASRVATESLDASDHYPVEVEEDTSSQTGVTLVATPKTPGWWTYCNGATVKCRASEFQDACKHFAGNPRATEFTLPKLNNFVMPNPGTEKTSPLQHVEYENGLSAHTHEIVQPDPAWEFDFKGRLTIRTMIPGGSGNFVHSGDGTPTGTRLSKLTCYFDKNGAKELKDKEMKTSIGSTEFIGADIETKPKSNRLLALVYLGEF